MHRFDGPAALDERICQVVEQLSMCRPFAAFSEVARSAHDSLTEMPLPYSISHDTGRQGIGRVSQPIRQFATAAADRDGRLAVARQSPRKAFRNQFSLIFRIAADEDPLLDDFAFGESTGKRRFGRCGIFELFQGALERSQACAPVFAQESFAILLGQGEWTFTGSDL